MKLPLKQKPSCCRNLRRPQRRTALTLCIAAACEDEKGRNRVVIGTDWMATGEIAAGADIQDKLYWVNDDIAVLVSGVVTRAVELRDAYRSELESMRAKSTKLNYRNLRGFIKAGPRLLKKDIAEEVVVFATGLSYAEFRNAIKTGEMTRDAANGVFRAIEAKDLECEVIIVAFVDKAPYIFQVERSGHVEERDNFALVGEGTYVAEAMLYFRKHESSDPLAMAIYNVWEALYMAARRVRTVSKTHSIDILIPPGERSTHSTAYTLTNSGFKFMKKLFQDQFGVRRITKFPSLPEGCVKQWKIEKKKAKAEAEATKAKKRSKVLSASSSSEEGQ
jgi:20S proteasome alpha/beta subunit